MNLKDKLRILTKEKRGILATNFYNLETLHAVLVAAKALKEPLILQLTQSSINYMGMEKAVQLAKGGLKEFAVEGWLHLDHGASVDLVQRCLDAGFDSVMIDGSEQSFEDNVAITTEVVKRAEAYGAHVEAELGYVAKLGQEQEGMGFTQPEEAKRFVEATGVDALAIAIGTAHGFYQSTPHLQLALLEEIVAACPDVTYVLHGSSGVPEEQIQAAISRGICKVNLATEIKNCFMQQLKDILKTTEEIDLRKVFPEATQAVTELVKKKMTVVKNIQSCSAD